MPCSTRYASESANASTVTARTPPGSQRHTPESSQTERDHHECNRTQAASASTTSAALHSAIVLVRPTASAIATVATFSAITEEASLSIAVKGDGEFHEYEVDLSQSQRWRGIVNMLRIDPVGEPDVTFALDYVRLQ